jgi:hypothetical protein
MGFLDNSGDIILDAVLTDAGRQRLARADGTFKVAQFALGDDEINYALYDNTNPSGSAYYDLNILQTPVFEAFTNNIASLNSKLLTIPRNDLLFLPVIKLNSLGNLKLNTTAQNQITGSFVVLVDTDTETKFKSATGIDSDNALFGFSLSTKTPITLDQGLASESAGTLGSVIDSDLKETQYIIEIDNRFGIIHNKDGTPQNPQDATKSFVDDDNIAQYFLSLGTDSGYVSDNAAQVNTNEVILGPKGTRLQFKIRPSIDLTSSDYLFNTLGIDMTIGSDAYKVIKTNVVITGATTGYSLSLPVSFVKTV